MPPVMLADDWCGTDESEVPLWTPERADMAFPDEDADRWQDADESIRAVEIQW